LNSGLVSKQFEAKEKGELDARPFCYDPIFSESQRSNDSEIVVVAIHRESFRCARS
jgi:hypothetical protein